MEALLITVTTSLRRWFIIHFAADMVFALPMFFAPRAFLASLGWPCVDPVTTRLVAAALFGIGIQSLLGRDEGVATYRAMLNLKIIWSGMATVGVLWSQLEGGPMFGWVVVAAFAAFNVVWSYNRWRLSAIA